MSDKPAVGIGVDELFKARGRWWCHLLCDDFTPDGLFALHQFAQQLGLPARAFHDPEGQPRPHYDLTPEYRSVAIEIGAQVLDRRQVVAFLKRGRERLQALQSSTQNSGSPDPTWHPGACGRQERESEL